MVGIVPFTKVSQQIHPWIEDNFLELLHLGNL